MSFDPVAEQAVQDAVDLLQSNFRAAVNTSAATAQTAIAGGMSQLQAENEHLARVQVLRHQLDVDMAAALS